MREDDIKNLTADELKDLIVGFLEDEKKKIEIEEKNDEEENEREAKSVSMMNGVINRLLDHVMQRINYLFSKIAQHVTSGLTNKIRFKKKLPRKQAEEFVKERALSGISTDKDELELYMERVEEKTDNQYEAVTWAQKEFNPLYSSYVDKNLLDPIWEFLYKPRDITKAVDDNKMPQGYNGYNVGGGG